MLQTLPWLLRYLWLLPWGKAWLALPYMQALLTQLGSLRACQYLLPAHSEFSSAALSMRYGSSYAYNVFWHIQCTLITVFDAV